MVDEDFLREMSKSRKDVVDEGDHKYRPLALVLAVLYRCNKQEIFWQKSRKSERKKTTTRLQSRKEGMIKEAGVDVEDGEEREQLLEVGFLAIVGVFVRC